MQAGFSTLFDKVKAIYTGYVKYVEHVKYKTLFFVERKVDVTALPSDQVRTIPNNCSIITREILGAITGPLLLHSIGVNLFNSIVLFLEVQERPLLSVPVVNSVINASPWRSF